MDGTVAQREQIEKTRDTLRILRDAWIKIQPDFDLTWAAWNLHKIPVICVILQLIEEPHRLDDFIQKQQDDSRVPYLSKEKLEEILQEPEAVQAFLAEQYRAIPRDWGLGGHIDLFDTEPLPLKHMNTWNENSGYATVDKVVEVHTGQVYARKLGKLKTSELHLRTELACLKELGDHYHIVQCVKTYQRGSDFGLLLKPAADHNLWILLKSYCARPRQRSTIMKTLFRTFGCLSWSLAFIHRTTRHKDIKPQNILFYKPKASDGRGKISKGRGHNIGASETTRKQLQVSSNEDEVIFLWADFGLSYNFSAKKDDRTLGGRPGTLKYAAPEYKDPFDPFEEHDLKSDVFQLGCVFLEILSVLLTETLEEAKPGNIQHILSTETLPPSQNSQATDSSSATLQDVQLTKEFRHKLNEINEWINLQLAALASDDPIAPLLSLSQQMIEEDKNNRPDVKKIVDELMSSTFNYFCHQCLREYSEQRPIVESRADMPRSLASQHTIHGLEDSMTHRKDTSHPFSPKIATEAMAVQHGNSVKPSAPPIDVATLKAYRQPQSRLQVGDARPPNAERIMGMRSTSLPDDSRAPLVIISPLASPIVSTATANHKRQPPALSVTSARHWRAERKQGKHRLPLPNESLLRCLDQRDHVSTPC